MNSVYVKFFFHIKNIKPHLVNDRAGRIFISLTRNDNKTQAELKHFINSPISFIQRKIEDCYLIFSPSKLGASDNRFLIEGNKKKLSLDGYDFLKKLGEVSLNEIDHNNKEISLATQYVNEINQKKISLNTYREVKAFFKTKANKQYEINKAKREIAHQCVSWLNKNKLTFYCYAIGTNTDDKKYVITNKLTFGNGNVFNDEVEFDIKISNSTFLGVKQKTCGFEESIKENQYELGVFNDAISFLMRKNYFKSIDKLWESHLDDMAWKASYEALSSIDKEIFGIYKSFFDPDENYNKYSEKLSYAIEELNCLEAIDSERSTNPDILPSWFVEFFNDFLNEKTKNFVESKVLFTNDISSLNTNLLFVLKQQLNLYLDFVTEIKFDKLSNIFQNQNLSFLNNTLLKRRAIILVQDKIGDITIDDNYMGLDLDKIYNELNLNNLANALEKIEQESQIPLFLNFGPLKRE